MADPNERIAISTWSLHRYLGTIYPHDLSTDVVGDGDDRYGEGEESLLGLPSVLHNHGYDRLEIVSFHLRSRDPVYLGELRDQLNVTGVTLQTLLIDAGDMTDPVNAARDTRWIAGWIDVANALGAENARIIAGKQPFSPETMSRSVAGFRELLALNAGSPLKLVTENWFDLLATPDAVHELLDRLEGQVGLLADMGNWTGPDKYEGLKSIFPRASLCHAKASFADGALDEVDYGLCLAAAEEAGYAGPYTLIFDAEHPGEWAGLAQERDFILARLPE